jgi:hypothetical protein
VRNRLGIIAYDVLTARRLSAILYHFEHNIKREFNPYDHDCPQEYIIPLVGNDVPDAPKVGLEDGYLTLSKSDLFDNHFSCLEKT